MVVDCDRRIPREMIEGLSTPSKMDGQSQNVL